jgi:quinoprotein glucose dehydrogenase
MSTRRARFVATVLPLVVVLAGATIAVSGQYGPKNGEWRYYGGDAGSTKYSPLDQINKDNVKDLKIVWRWKAENLGPRPDFNFEATPLMVNGVLYTTAGSRRDAVAIDGETGETLWLFALNEGVRGQVAPVRAASGRGVAYWTDGREERIFHVTPGYHLAALDAKTGRPIAGFGKDGVVDLTLEDDRAPSKPGELGLNSPPIVVGDVVIVGAAALALAPQKEFPAGFVRGYDARTGKRIWIFHTIPTPGEFGNDTWEGDSWSYTGNTGVWGPMAADLDLGYVYLPVETPTNDTYGGHRPGNGLFGETLVCLDAKTGKRIWHYQFVHHGVWDYDNPTTPDLIDITVNGRRIKAIVQTTKQAFAYVLDRTTGVPVWPIVERPVPQSDVPGEKTSPTQPFPTKPAGYDWQGVSLDTLIDFTPELKAEAVKIASQYKLGPLFTPPIVYGSNGGLKGTLTMPRSTGGSNWQGGAVDPETGMLYVSSVGLPGSASLVHDPKRNAMDYIGGGGGGAAAEGRAPAGPPPDPYTGRVLTSDDTAPRPRGLAGVIRAPVGCGEPGPQGLPLTKPPYGRITAIDLNTGDHVWMIPNGDTPDCIKNHPALQGVNIPKTGKPERAGIMVTKTLVFAGEGAGLHSVPAWSGGPMFRALDKKTGAILWEFKLPSNQSGIPMSYMIKNRQYIAVAVGGRNQPAELVALALP